MPNVIHFNGRAASAPVLTHPNSNSICKITLIRNEYAGTTENGEQRPERVVAIQFTAFGKRADAIAQHVSEGDQIFITARIDNNNYKKDDGTEVFGFNFIVEDFEFGAPGPKKREQLAKRSGAN